MPREAASATPTNFWDFIDPTRDGTVGFFDFLGPLAAVRPQLSGGAVASPRRRGLVREAAAAPLALRSM